MWISQRPAVKGLGADEVVEGRLRACVEGFARPRHFWAEPRENRRVGERLAADFARLGFDVCFQGPYRNVIALPNTRKRLVLVCAHYDSVPGCPGADDNASGLAVMLECALAVQRRRANLAVGFVAFNAEEDGLLGSTDFVTNGLTELGLDVAMVHVLEMCGYRTGERRSQGGPWWLTPPSLSRGTFIAVIGHGASNRVARRVIAEEAPLSPRPHRVVLQTWPPARRLVRDLERSDHAPFWDVGIPAVLWTDTGNLRNPHYHRRSDTPDTLDYGFMHGVAGCLVDMLLHGRFVVL